LPNADITICVALRDVQSLPANNPPAHSCRAALAQLLSRTGANGRLEAIPMHMQLRRRAGIDDAYHVINFNEATMDEVCVVCMVHIIGTAHCQQLLTLTPAADCIMDGIQTHTTGP
jgi:hypothetical protein